MSLSVMGSSNSLCNVTALHREDEILCKMILLRECRSVQIGGETAERV
jgi:hypothetical protein